MTWIDISIPLHNAMVHWPGDPAFVRDRVKNMEKGDADNVSQISMGSHSGTHIDAPRHFIQNGIDIGSMPIDISIGVSRVIEIQDSHLITPEELAGHKIRRGERLIFKTRNSATVWRTNNFVEDFVSISAEAAFYLAERKIKMMGIDYLSVGAFKSHGAEIHRTLLKAGIWLIEGLDLSQVTAGRYYLICLPLRIMDGDGAPARAILRPI